MSRSRLTTVEEREMITVWSTSWKLNIEYNDEHSSWRRDMSVAADDAVKEQSSPP
jgi:hypothetical protein